MAPDSEIFTFLKRHLQAIQENNLGEYQATCGADLTLYEWWITPHRLDGLAFHEFMMTENARRGTVFGAPETPPSELEPPRSRYDLANLQIQQYGDCAIASYTLLTSTGTVRGVQVTAHNESRVMVKSSGDWKVVHVHKSPAWQAPHTQPAQAG